MAPLVTMTKRHRVISCAHMVTAMCDTFDKFMIRMVTSRWKRSWRHGCSTSKSWKYLMMNGDFIVVTKNNSIHTALPQRPKITCIKHSYKFRMQYMKKAKMCWSKFTLSGAMCNLIQRLIMLNKYFCLSPESHLNCCCVNYHYDEEETTSLDDS